MNKVLFTLGLASALYVSSLSADPLKNSLNNLLNEKDSSGMVNLGGVGVGAKPKPQVQQPVRKSRPGSAIIGHYNDGKPVRKKEANAYLKKATKGKIKDLDLLPRKQRLMVLKDLQKIYAMKNFKSRPPKAVIATVNGKEIRKKEADTYLKNVTAGKVKDFDRLDEKQRLVLVKDLARPIVIMEAIDGNITEEEREVIYKQMWIEKQKATIEVSSDEMLALYEMKKEKTLAANPQAEIPHFMSLGESLKAEIIEKKMMSNLLKDVNISINYDTNITNDENNTTSVTLDNTQNTKEIE